MICLLHSTVKDVDINNESVNVSHQIIWHNKHVVYDSESLFHKGWYDSGLVYLGDLFMEDGFRSIEYITSQVRSKRQNVMLYLTMRDLGQ